MGSKSTKSKSTRQDIDKPITGLQTTPEATQNTTTSAYNLGTAEDVKVSKWLKSVGNRILIYQDAFAEYGFDSLESISTMRKQDLHDLKVKTGHRRILLAAVKKLKEDLQNQAQKNTPIRKISKTIDEAQSNAPIHTKQSHSLKSSKNSSIKNDHKETDNFNVRKHRKTSSPEYKEVNKFLKSLPGDLSVYSSDFVDHGYDSIEAIMLMKEQDVAAILPSDKRGHHQVLLHGIVELHNRKNRSMAPSIELRNKNITKEHFNATKEIAQIKAETVIYRDNLENMDESDLIMATSQPRLSPRSRLSRIEKVVSGTYRTPSALRSDLKHVYVLSGRDRLPSHRKRFTGTESKYSRWDAYAYTAERYNPETDVWSTIPIEPCFGSGTACGCKDGFVRSTIGYSWSPCTGLNEMPFPAVRRSWGDCIAGDNCVYSMGGYEGQRGLTNICEKFNTLDNSWQYIAPLPTPRHSLSLARNDFKKNVYAVGGIGGNQNFSQKTLSVIEEYNEVTGKWNKLQDMLSVRTGMRAIFNQYKNALFVLGGKSEVKGSVLRSVESFDSRSGQWNKWADMIYARTFFGCVILPSNDILCVGGKKSNEYQTTCEILDIRANRWRIASSMNHIRHSVPHSNAGNAVTRRCRGYTVALL